MRVALVGNPNSGKTTLFNRLTKSSAHVGNYPGVTVAKKEGIYKDKVTGVRTTIIDLPGIYSLSPYSPEEIVARNVIINDKPDVIINIVDVTNIERNLYLTTQLLETDRPMVVALNMMDIAKKRGIVIDVNKLQEQLGVPVVFVSALKGKGLNAVMREVKAQYNKERNPVSPLEHGYLSDLFNEAKSVYSESNIDGIVFHAVKAIEQDELEIKQYPALVNKLRTTKSSIKNEFDGDFEGMVADCRYKYISSVVENVVSGRVHNHDKMTISDKVDKILTHKIFSFPLFALIMFLVFHLTFSEDLFYLGAIGVIPSQENETFFNMIFGNGAINSPGVIFFNLVETGTNAIIDVLTNTLPEGMWYSSLIIDALCGGIFSVLSFIPQILVLFFFLSILEDTGYMARVAFILDRAFRRFGLSGRAVLPLISCFGCAVPGVMGTRTLESDKERRLAILLTPFFSCGAKLPIWGAIGGVLFAGRYADLIVFSMYFIGIAVAILSAILLRHSVFKGEGSLFIMELPEYHIPQWRNTVLVMWDKLKHYIFRAATVIAGATVVIWFLTSFDFDFWNGLVEMDKSIMGRVANVVRYLFVPLGFGMGSSGWMFVVSAFTGLIAKEMVVSTMGTLGGMSDDALSLEGSELIGSGFGMVVASLVNGWAGWQAVIAFMAFNLLSVPCMAAVGAVMGELKNKKHFWFAIGYWLATAYIVSMLLYWSLRVPAIGIALVSLIVAVVVAVIIVLKIKRKKAMNFKEDDYYANIN